MFSFPYDLLLLLAFWAIKSYFKKEEVEKDNLAQDKPKVKQPTFEKVEGAKKILVYDKHTLHQFAYYKSDYWINGMIISDRFQCYYAHVIDIPEPFEDESQSHLVLLLNNKYALQTTTNSPVNHNACNTCGNQFLKDRREYMSNLN